MSFERKKRRQQDVNASSMADIAFLLLIFFLVTTTIHSDWGLAMRLPPMWEKNNDQPIHSRNVYNVLLNSQNQLLVEEEPMEVGKLKEAAKKFIANNGKNPHLSESPKDAVISLKADRGTRYEVYVGVLDEIKGAYYELRADYLGISLMDYLQLDLEKPTEKALLEKAQEMYPLQISEAEPSKVEK
jgi:biopolymer transport protein ExbD